MSLYRQLWLAIIASMLLALCGGLLASLLSARAYLESQLSIKNTDNATALALSLSQSDPDSVTVDLVVASLFDSGHYERIQVVDPVGKVLSERVAPAGVFDAPAWFAQLLPIHAQAGQAQISNGWKQFGTVVLVSHSRFAYGALWKSAYEMALALALAGVVGGYLGALVLGRIRGPLQAVIAQAQDIVQRRFVTIEEPRVPELKKLAVAMNTTVVRLRGMFEEEATRLEAVRREANHDALTGLLNRSYFMARLRQEVESEESQGGALLLVRVTHLADVNRRLGRQAADALLKDVADVLSQAAQRCPRAWAARLNGADFALLLPTDVVAADLATSVLQTLRQRAAPFLEASEAVCAGLAAFVHGADVSELLARVDVALASAEAQGGYTVQKAATETSTDLPRTAEQWATMMERALQHGWVRLISFPVVDARGQLSHRECPLRLMFDAQGEWLPAGRFLPIAERLKLTAKLDLAAVALGLQELRAQPALPGLAVNLSASSFEDANFQTQLLALVDGATEHASRLWLEVAEAGALQHLPAFRALCQALSVRGCRTGLEHFGHHFSQIGALHELGLDYLKVDASFVRGLDAHPGNTAFLKGLCNIAHTIGLQVLAEGVSTPQELAAVLQVGFDGATGPGVHEAAP